MQVAISNKYPRTIVRYCAFHIRQNLVKKIKRKLNVKWNDFIREFYALRNSLVIADFENHWAELMLHSGIELQLKDEAKYSRLQEFCNMNLTTGMPQVSNIIFKSVDEIYKKTWIKETGNIVLQDKNWYSTGFMEDDYEEPQILLDMALKDCSDGIYSEEDLMIAEKVFEKSVQIIENEYQLKQTGTFLMINTIRGQDVYSGFVKHLDSKKEQYGRSFGLCKKALNLAIKNKSIQIFEEILQ
ncbi:unnamed protein product [Rhizophagus irregularis]|nr:unnamed protein product [Rhizophagus irregularis]